MNKQTINIRPADLKLVRQILCDILPANAKVWVFGSRSTLKIKNASDLDLAIDIGRPLTRQEDTALADAFDESPLSYRVDVVDMHNINDTFKAIINKRMVRLELDDLEKE